MKDRKLIQIIGVVLCVGLLWFYDYSSGPKQSVQLGNKRFYLDIARTPAQRERGLSGRPNLPYTGGMLFTYEEPKSPRCFWMNAMRFPLDIIWLDQNKTIWAVEDNVTPDTYPTSFCPDVDAQYVIEVRAGMTQALDLKIGTQLHW